MILKSVQGHITLTCLVECPHCEEVIDLYEITELTDDSYIYKETIPNNRMWGNENLDLTMDCTKCNLPFHVGAITI